MGSPQRSGVAAQQTAALKRRAAAAKAAPFPCLHPPPGLAAAVDAPKTKRALARWGAVLLATVPWSQAAVAAERGVSVAPGALAAAGVVGVGIHLAYLALNVLACRWASNCPASAASRQPLNCRSASGRRSR